MSVCRLCKQSEVGDSLPRLHKYSTRHYAHPACIVSPHAGNGPCPTRGASDAMRRITLAKFFLSLRDWEMRDWPVIRMQGRQDVAEAFDNEIARRWPDGDYGKPGAT